MEPEITKAELEELRELHEGLVEILNGIEGLQEQRDALKAKLAALVEACSTWQEWGGHCDTCEFVRQRAANTILDTALFADYCDCGWHATREALAAAKEPEPAPSPADLVQSTQDGPHPAVVAKRHPELKASKAKESKP